MFSRLLACLAFLTGLTAVGAPAQAVVFETALAGLQQTAGAEKPCKGEACDCPGERRETLGGATQKTPCKPAPTITIVIPTVQLGPDRARE